MKKLLLSAAMLLSLASFAQHTQTATGFTNNADAVGTGDPFEFFTYYTSGGGGHDYAQVDTMRSNLNLNGNSTAYHQFILSSAVNLSSPNNRLRFYIAATGKNEVDTSFNVSVSIEDNATNHLCADFPVTLTQDYQLLDLTLVEASAGSLAGVRKFVISVNNPVSALRVANIYITKIEAGSLITSTTSASALVSSSKLFPNPTNDNANVELNLKSASDVKITLSDVMGKEVMTIAEGTFASMNQSFSVANLNKGVYTVNYTVNGAPAKSELLMVK